MATLKDMLGADEGMSLWLPGDSEPRVYLSLTETRCKRERQRIIKPTEMSWSNVPSFGQVRKRATYRWELDITLLMQEYLALEQLIQEADELMIQDTQQYLLLFDRANRVDVTVMPDYIVSVIDPLETVTVDGHDYAYCVFNVYLESLTVDATYASLIETTNVSLILHEV